MTDSPPNRCGYTYPDDFDPTHEPDPAHQSCCYRRAWREFDCCIWHADVESSKKPMEELRTQRETEENRELNGGKYERVYSGPTEVETTPRELLDGSKMSGFKTKDSIDLLQCGLRGANFIEADLRGADLTNARFVNTDLTGAVLANTDFTDAVLYCVDLSDTVLSKANLVNADLREATLIDAFLLKANLTNAYLPEADLTEADLSIADLSDAYLEDARLCDATLNGDLTEAILRNADLTDAILKNADLTEADLRDANLTHANLQDIDLTDAAVQRATLTNADIRDGNLTNTYLTDADLTEANLTDADLTEADLRDANLIHADLQDSNLIKSDLKEATLTDADLENASLSGANIERTKLLDVDLFNANLNGAKLHGARLGGAAINTETTLVDDDGYCIYDHRSSHKYESVSDEESEIRQTRKAMGAYQVLEQLAGNNAFPDKQATCFIHRQDMRREQLRIQESFPRLKFRFSQLQNIVFRYGESFSRVVSWSIATIVFFTFLFPLGGWLKKETPTGEVVQIYTYDEIIDSPVLLWESFNHSALLFLSGSGPLKPSGTVGEVLTTTEALVAPILLALIVFVLGRRAAR